MAENTSYTEQVNERLSDAIGDAKNRTSELGRTLAEKVEETRDAAAGAVHSASESLHAKAENLPGGRPIADMAHSAADRLDSAAGYLAEHDTKELLGDVGSLVKQHPGKSLLVAVVVGFFLGRTFARD